MHLEQRIRVGAKLRGQAVGHLLVYPLQLKEERDLLFFLVGVLEDLLALALHVGRGHLALGPLGKVSAGRHRESRRDGAKEPGREDEARTPCRAGDPRDDPKHRREAVVGAVDRTRDPARARAVP